MFERLKSLFRRKKQERPNPERLHTENAYFQRAAPSNSRITTSAAANQTTRRDDSNDLLNPMNPMSFASQSWHSSPSTHSDCSSRQTDYYSSSDCSSSSSDSCSSSDSGSGSGCD